MTTPDAYQARDTLRTALDRAGLYSVSVDVESYGRTGRVIIRAPSADALVLAALVQLDATAGA